MNETTQEVKLVGLLLADNIDTDQWDTYSGQVLQLSKVLNMPEDAVRDTLGYARGLAALGEVYLPAFELEKEKLT